MFELDLCIDSNCLGYFPSVVLFQLEFCLFFLVLILFPQV